METKEVEILDMIVEVIYKPSKIIEHVRVGDKLSSIRLGVGTVTKVLNERVCEVDFGVYKKNICYKYVKNIIPLKND